MSLHTVGQLHVTPLRVITTASLSDVHSAICNTLYTGAAADVGWSATDDSSDWLVGSIVEERPAGVAPGGIFQMGTYPKQFRCRLFWDEESSVARKAVGDVGDRKKYSVIKAADVIFAESSVEGELLLLAGEGSEATLRKTVLPAISRVFKTVDGNASLFRDGHIYEFGDDDFFRWLMHGHHTGKPLGSQIGLASFRNMVVRDGTNRPTHIGDGVDIDRPELLALLSATSNSFGPAKIAVYDASMGLRVSLEIHATGKFSVYRGETEYDDGEKNVTDYGTSVLQDVAFEILPEMKRLHNADTAWSGSGRVASITDARSELATFSANLPAPV